MVKRKSQPRADFSEVRREKLLMANPMKGINILGALIILHDFLP